MNEFGPPFLRRWLARPYVRRHVIALVFIPFFAVCVFVMAGFKNLMILVNEGRTTATLAEVHSHRGRVSSTYRYEVNGNTHTGHGLPEHPPFTPPFEVGYAFEIRYSRLLPFFSTPDNPLTIFGQFGVGCLFLLWGDFMAVRYGKKRNNPPA